MVHYCMDRLFALPHLPLFSGRLPLSFSSQERLYNFVLQLIEFLLSTCPCSLAFLFIFQQFLFKVSSPSFHYFLSNFLWELTFRWLCGEYGLNLVSFCFVFLRLQPVTVTFYWWFHFQILLVVSFFRSLARCIYHNA